MTHLQVKLAKWFPSQSESQKVEFIGQIEFDKLQKVISHLYLISPKIVRFRVMSSSAKVDNFLIFQDLLTTVHIPAINTRSGQNSGHHFLLST
jgi:hypothetical protein